MICVDAHCRIELGNNNLTKVPEELWLFENLNKYVVFFLLVVLLKGSGSLNLSDNRITMVPPEIGKWTKLTR